MAKNHEYEHVRVPWWTDMIMYWLEDQVAIAFHSNHHPSTDRESIITSLELNKLNQFLQPRGFELMPFTQPQQVLDNFHTIHRRMQPSLQRLFSLTPKTPFEIRRTEAFREASASAEWNYGSLDGTRHRIDDRDDPGPVR